ncbi:D-glycero-beta-D-manno-heptose 1-phosphate adenylyltransferase [Humibacter sp.]|uniref:D-glycero-beta-D-manno-heptose 1-phosphate adenylyltransferase n=1 Tax=Humibacter sp. TaxID=1940291 RepID=UPI002D028C10|nr:D-glycero-beta-D-manno-heptose 1-phosphate adenylyltransferase [Humibacter sp.]HVX09003.1 D-glycero-beta-D-manno-heptose 1-phosphate adenylyltransferase [Humibacter sp.]
MNEHTLDVVRAIGERRPRIAVVGDLMLDVWSYGAAGRLAREAPAPVVEVRERRNAPGGAANTAMNLAAIGAEVHCFGVVGVDDAADTLLQCLRQAGIDTSGIVAHDDAHTPVKHRIVCDDQVLLRLDEAPRRVPQDAVDTLIRTAAVAHADAFVIGDYGSTAMAAVAEGLRPARTGQGRPLVVVDAHDIRRWRGIRADIATPNAAEAATALGTRLPEGGDRASFFTERADELLEVCGGAAVVVTLDRDGAVLLGEHPHRTHAHRVSEKNASGAGDTFVAVLSAACACGAPIADAMDAAQTAADVVVHKPDTAVCSLEELAARADGSLGVTLAASDLARRVDQHRARGERVVFTNGCFDVLHRGHTTYLRQAKELGDVLVVAVNDDETVRRLKGPGRPVNPAHDRADVIAALECVDYVTIFAEPTPVELISALHPDVYVKGGDYTAQMLEEASVVESYGGEVVFADYVPDHSTSGIVERIRSGVVS